MYSILFYPTDKCETYIKPRKFGSEPCIPLGVILSWLLNVETDSDIDQFLNKYGCNGCKLLNMVQYHSTTGKALKQTTEDYFSTIRNEKKQLLYALDSYKKLTDQYPLSNKKYSHGRTFTNYSKTKYTKGKQLPFDLILTQNTYELFRDSANYMRIESILGEHAAGRLSSINIGLKSAKENNKSRIDETTIDNTTRGDKSSSIRSYAKKFISLSFTYKFSSEDFLALPWLEFIEIIKEKALIKTCDKCNRYFFDALRETKKWCTECGPKSLDASQRTDDEKNRKTILQYIRRNNPSKDELKKYLENHGLSEKLIEGFKPRKRKKKESE